MFFSSKQFPELQEKFFTTTFLVMGYIAKLDGVVSKQEIRSAEKIMQFLGLDDKKRAVAIELFSKGKGIGVQELEKCIDQLYTVGRWRRDVLQLFLEIQIRMAYDDAKPTEKERNFLYQISQRLGFNQHTFARLEKLYWLRQQFQQQAGNFYSNSSSHSYHQQYQAPPKQHAYSLSQAYDILGVTAHTPLKDIKKAYRKLMSQHHPDKLVSRGLPAEMMKVATEKTQEIKKAYDYIISQRQAVS